MTNDVYERAALELCRIRNKLPDEIMNIDSLESRQEIYRTHLKALHESITALINVGVLQK